MGVQPVGYGVLQAAWILISMILQISNGQGKIWNLFFWLPATNCQEIKIVGNMQMP